MKSIWEILNGRGVVSNVAPGNTLKMSCMVALCLLLVTAAIAVSKPVFAQEKGVTYVGNLGGGKKGCPLNATDIQIEIKGTKVNGFWVETSDVKPKFKGDMAGSSFKIIRESKAGNQSSIAGELIDGKLEVRFVAPKCNYRAVLKPQA